MAVVVEFRCKKHKSYEAKRPPRANCQACRELYHAKQTTEDTKFSDGSVVQERVLTDEELYGG